MKNLSTKERGLIAELEIKLDLIKQGFSVVTPDGDYLPFDLLCITENYTIYKIQVKYRTVKNGKISVDLRKRQYSSAKVYNRRPYSKDEVDIFAIYVPELDTCFYINSDILDQNTNAVELRVREPKNNQCIGIKSIWDYSKFPITER